jgi:hypothetical protein
MFTAYFDESGTLKDSNAFTVAGGVSSIKKWLQFEERWKAIFKAHGVGVFHMADRPKASESSTVGLPRKERSSLLKLRTA